MTDKEFDDIIKNKLSAFENNSKPDWNSFSKKLEESEKSEKEFDALIAAKLKNFTKPVKSSHWELLRKRLIKEEFVRRKVYSLKSIESFSLLLLLLITLNNQYVKFDFAKYTDPTLYAELFNRNEVLPKRINNQLVFNEKINVSSSEIEVVVDDEVIKEENNDVVIDQNLFTVPFQSLKSVPIVNVFSTKIREINNTIGDEILLATDGERTSVEPFDGLEQIVLKDQMKSLYKPYVDTRFIYNPHMYNKGFTFYDLSIYGNSGMVQVNSPYDPIYDVESNKRYGKVSKIGVLFGAGTERFKLKTGLEYQSISYKPQQVEEIFGSMSNGLKKYSLDGIKFDIISVPMRVSVNMLKSEKASLNLLAGVNTNAIFNADHRIQETELSREETISLNSAFPTGQRSVKQEPKLFQKTFSKGVFSEGGLDNIYFDANVEVEYERKINDTKSFQIALGTSRFLGSKGVGPNNDALHGVYARLGLSYKLN